MLNLLAEKVERFHLLGHLLQVGPGVALDAEKKGRFETMIGEQTCFQKVISMQEAFIQLARESVTGLGKTDKSDQLLNSRG